jgi:Gas vesicle synthesis protein GvpL/GvpF
MWLYAVCDRPDLPVPRRRGLAQAPLEGVGAEGLLAAVSRHEHAPAEPALDALWVHERVVERLMADRAVLPMRFGTTVAGEQEVRDALTARREEFAAALDRVRGRVELGLRVLAQDGRRDDEPAPATGRDYLLGRLAADARSQQLASDLHAPLRALSVADRRRPPGGDGEVLRAAYLVETQAVARFRATVERLQRDHPELGLLCTGPWPPYNFAGAEQ